MADDEDADEDSEPVMMERSPATMLAASLRLLLS